MEATTCRYLVGLVMELETVRIASQDIEEQGEFVVINKEDFDEAIHVLYEPVTEKKK